MIVFQLLLINTQRNCSDILLKLKFPIKALFIRYNSDWLNTVSYVSSSSQMCLVSFRSDMLNIWLKIDFLQFKKHVWHSFKENIPIVSTFLQSELNEYMRLFNTYQIYNLTSILCEICWANGEIQFETKMQLYRRVCQILQWSQRSFDEKKFWQLLAGCDVNVKLIPKKIFFELRGRLARNEVEGVWRGRTYMKN